MYYLSLNIDHIQLPFNQKECINEQMFGSIENNSPLI